MKCLTSIFNDVIGPVMRGASSSHVAAAARIGELIRQSVDTIKSIEVDFDPNGSLAESYHGHGSDMGLASGILGIKLTDDRVINALNIIKERNINLKFNIVDYKATHPNNYRIKVTSEDNSTCIWEAISTGGGMIEMTRYNGSNISICGDYYELILLCRGKHNEVDNITEIIKKIIPSYDHLLVDYKEEEFLLNIKTNKQIEDNILDKLKNTYSIYNLVYLEPVLPIKSSASCKLPFNNVDELLNLAKESNLELWQLAVLYESSRGNISEDEVFDKMSELVSIMTNCIEIGLNKTEYKDRILGPQAYKISEASKNNLLMPSDVINNVIKYITSIMEVKSSMGVIVAAPTAGSCGCLPGTIIGVGKTYGMTNEQIVKGMLAASVIGIFISEKATFSAEIAGCQVECGAGSGMAAAGVAQMFGGSVNNCIDAASIALQGITGLACDPVANRVEVPCLNKNIMCGVNAITSANMALAGFDKVIPLEETIEAIYDIGLKLPLELRCTLGGLGKTKSSWQLREHLS